MAYKKAQDCKKKLRAVFYARVSTEEERQLNALEKQIQENKDIIAEMGWELVDEYIDEGKSGTTTKRRNEYNRLLEDMDADKFDIIVTKDQDRLQRNTKDWYLFVDRLVTNKLQLYIYLDNKYFTPNEDALITGIKAILAEEYSRNLSKKLNNSNRKRIERAKNGEPISAMGNGQTYGYKIVDGKWVIDKEQEEIVRKMYELYSELHSVRKTRNALNELGYRNQKGKLFTDEVVGRVLKNEKHKGWVILNRYHRDFETKEIIENPEDEWVIVKNDHEPIVSEELWDAVNNEILSHRNEGNNKGRGRKVGTDLLSGKMYCRCCGRVMWKHQARGSYKTKEGRKTMYKAYTQWYCSGKMGRGDLACVEPAIISGEQIKKYLVNIADEYLDESTIQYSKTLLKKKSIKWLEDLKAQLSTPNNNIKIEADIEKLEKKKSRLIDAYTDELISKDEFKAKSMELEEILTKQKSLLVPIEENSDIKEIEETIQNIDNEIELLFANEAELEENKIKFLVEHLKKITVAQNKDALIILDKLVGAFIFSQNGKLRAKVIPVRQADSEEETEEDIDGEIGGEVLPFVRESVYFTEQTVKDNKIQLILDI